VSRLLQFILRKHPAPVLDGEQPDRRDPDTTFRDGYQAGMTAVLRLVADGEITQRSAFFELDRVEGRRNAA
jgi:hypothetical protein